ncbi:DNA-binding IclR family transcriptional regulator [Catenulispora sp. MAP12-49]|jgi:DNA-binding IclR family transcriptional regulator|uniref:IclR family transcriptional regulator n=1 Tax=unclassified Catenulispora TaxID=414885 RepID=UPI003512F45F
MTRTDPAPEPETSQTLDRGIRVLTALADATAGLTVAQLAERVGAPRTAGYRLVATLEAHGLARRDPDGRVHLGVGVLRLAARVHPLLREAATPPLRRLAEAVGATAHLTVAEGPDALAIAVVEPTWTDYHMAYRVGSRHRLAQGAAGKAILLGRSTAGRPPSMTKDPAMLYTASEGELQAGAHGIAAPIREVPGLEASVGVVSFAPLDTGAVAPRVIQAAAEISAALK